MRPSISTCQRGKPSQISCRPSSASAITQTLRWLDPPPGTILHVRSVETKGGHTTTRELWQSADRPQSERQLIDGPQSFESAGGALYDPATNTWATKARIWNPSSRLAPTTRAPCSAASSRASGLPSGPIICRNG